MTGGMLILLGETAYLAVWKNLIISAIIFMAAMMIFAKEIKSGNSTGKKKSSYLLLFCCFTAGISIGIVSDLEDRETKKLIDKNVRIEGKVTDVHEGEKSLRITVKAGSNNVVVYVKNGTVATNQNNEDDVEREDIDVAKNEADAANSGVYVVNNSTDVERKEINVAKNKGDVAREEINVAKNKDDVARKEINVAKNKDDVARKEINVAKNKDDVEREDIRVGMYIVAEGFLEMPEGSTNPGAFDIAEYYSGKGILGVMYVDHVDVQRKKDHIMYALGYLRDSLEESLHNYFSDDRASFLSAMLLGDKSGLDRKQKLMYQKNGFAHILAISGMHVSIIALAFEKLLEMLGVRRKLRCTFAMILIILYGLMTGFAPPVVRAIVMLVLRYTAFLVRRSFDVPTDMMLAILIMAILNPQSVFTAGLQLSFAAAAAMYISDRIYINYIGWRSRIFLYEKYGGLADVKSENMADEIYGRSSDGKSGRLADVKSEDMADEEDGRLADVKSEHLSDEPFTEMKEHGELFEKAYVSDQDKKHRRTHVKTNDNKCKLLGKSLCARHHSFKEKLIMHIKEFGRKNYFISRKNTGRVFDRKISNISNNKTVKNIQKSFAGFKKKSLMDKNTFIKRIKEGIGRIIISTLAMNIILTPLLIYYYYEIYPYSMILGIIILITVSYVIAGGFITAILGMLCMLISSGISIGTFAGFIWRIIDFFARASAMFVDLILNLYEKVCDMGFRLPLSGINTGHTSVWMCVIYYIFIIALVSSILRNPRRGAVRKNKVDNKPEHEIYSFLIQYIVSSFKRVDGLILSTSKSIREEPDSLLRLKRKGIRILRHYSGMAYLLCALFIFVVGDINRYSDRVVILDVGQGSSAIVHFSDGRNYILDGGSTSKEAVGEYVIIPALKYYGMSDITGIFVSHTDEDHINGLIELACLKSLYRLRIRALYMAEGTKQDENYLELEDLAGVKISGVSEGDVVDGCFKIIYPYEGSDIYPYEESDFYPYEELDIYPCDVSENQLTDASARNEMGEYRQSRDSTMEEMVTKISNEQDETENSGNDYSLVVMMDGIFNGREIKILFPGDIGSEVEKRIVEDSIIRGKDISADVLIAPHHGSRYSSSSTFLEKVSCKTVIISCGKNNLYGHPAPETLERMDEAGCRIIRTDKSGAVIIDLR